MKCIVPEFKSKNSIYESIDFQMEENQLRFICTYCLRKKESLQVAPAFDKLRQRLDLLYPGGYQLKSGYNDEALCTIGLMLEL